MSFFNFSIGNEPTFLRRLSVQMAVKESSLLACHFYGTYSEVPNHVSYLPIGVGCLR